MESIKSGKVSCYEMDFSVAWSLRHDCSDPKIIAGSNNGDSPRLLVIDSLTPSTIDARGNPRAIHGTLWALGRWPDRADEGAPARINRDEKRSVLRAA